MQRTLDPVFVLRTSLAAAVLGAALSAQADAAVTGTSFPSDRLGGVATVADMSPNAFGYPAPSLSRLDRRRFLVGNSFFKQNWIEAPASTSARDGLGPLFNARSCSACHLRDGRSAPPGPTDRERHGLLVRIGVRRPGAPDSAHPIYGGQVQDAAVQGARPEARVELQYEPVAGQYGDGTPFELQRPRYRLHEPAYGELGDDVTLGPRTAPQIIGLGLLEAVPASALHELADPDDTDGDGISGRVHRLDDSGVVVGRFGWKATQPTVAGQVAAAFVNDMGITSPTHPREVLTAPQRSAFGFEVDEIDITQRAFDRVVFYTQALAVPAQRDPDAVEVVRGRVLFHEMGCATCHVETLVTGDAAFAPSYERQVFHPFTDLLLHDMGPALADGKRDGDARPAEWRTPPLWGIGLLETVSGHERLLHDGRARGIAEAILWHGGEGESARRRFRNASQSDRTALLRFVRSL